MKVHRTFASLYVRYVVLVNKLGDIYDQTLQVQKRKVVETILTAATQRMMELQKELTSIEMSEFVYIDQTLIEDKFIPQDIKLLCPFYYPAKRQRHIENMLLGNFETSSVKNEQTPEQYRISREKSAIIEKMKMWDDVMTLIKKHEKAR